MTGMMVDRVKAEREARVKAMVSRLAKLPELSDLDAEGLRRVADGALFDEMKAKMKRAADIERVDYQDERAKFIAQAGRTHSERTRDLYHRGLLRLESWCAVHDLAPLELDPAHADDWVEAEKANSAPATVRLIVAAASSFWTWLERRHVELRNPFRGTRSRPQRKSVRRLEIPTDDEVALIERSVPARLRAAVIVMSEVGLRVGGLPGLSISGARWTTTSKGKAQSGKVPDSVRAAIVKAGLSLRTPFKDWHPAAISKAFEYYATRLHDDGKIHAVYSVHDLRHAFAIRLYQDTRDIYRVKQELGHSSVSVTEAYLRSLEVEELTQ